MKKVIKKFNNWLHFNCPDYESIDGWDTWEKKYKKDAPVRYFITHTLPKPYKRIKYALSDVSSWVRYRIVRYHVMDSGLGPGYYDKDTLLLHTTFNMLKDFVEVEKAWMQYVWNNDKSGVSCDIKIARKLHIPYYEQIFFRSPKLGLKYLAWETTLDNPKLPVNERNPQQAEKAREIVDLYNWWVHIRPSRKEYEYPERESDEDEGIFTILSDDWRSKNPVEYEIHRNISDKNDKLEEQWDKEDEENLIRLVKIRKQLWT